jgi:hypothetical protein
MGSSDPTRTSRFLSWNFVLETPRQSTAEKEIRRFHMSGVRSSESIKAVHGIHFIQFCRRETIWACLTEVPGRFRQVTEEKDMMLFTTCNQKQRTSQGYK